MKSNVDRNQRFNKSWIFTCQSDMKFYMILERLPGIAQCRNNTIYIYIYIYSKEHIQLFATSEFHLHLFFDCST